MKKVESIALVLLFGFCVTASAQTGAKKKVPMSKAMVPGIEFQESDLTTVLDYLRVKAVEAGAQPSNIVVYDPNGSIGKRNPNITLKLSNIPLSDVLKYVTELSDTSFLVDRNAIVIGEKAELGALRIQRTAVPASVAGKNAQILQMARTPVPSIDFSEVDLASALDFFRVKANPEGGNGVPVNLWLKENAAGTIGDRLVTLKLNDVSLLDAFRYATEQAGCSFRLDSIAIAIGEPDALAMKPKIRVRQGNALIQKMSSVFVENVELIETPMKDAIDYVKYHTKDQSGFPGGVNIISQVPEGKVVSMKFAKARAIDILTYVCEATESTFSADATAVMVKPQPPKAKEEPEE